MAAAVTTQEMDIEQARIPEVVASSVSGGLARLGVYLAGDDVTVTATKPPKKLLQEFTLVEVLCPDVSKSITHQCYDASKGANFEKTCDSASYNTAAALHFQGWGASAEDKAATVSQPMSSEYIVYNVEFLPTMTFAISRDVMQMCAEAKFDAQAIGTDINKATQFINKYGDHLSEGKHTLGGVLIKKRIIYSANSLTRSQMRREGEVFDSLAAISGGTSGGHAQNLMTGFSSSAENSNGVLKTQLHVWSYGPPTSDPRRFKRVLYGNPSWWRLIDRGMEFVPVWDILDRDGFHTAAVTVRHAWQEKTLRTKDLPTKTLRLLQSGCGQGGGENMHTAEVKDALGTFARQLKLQLKDPTHPCSRPAPHKLVELAGDVIVFAGRLEGMLPVGSGTMNVLIQEEHFRELVLIIIRGEGKDFQYGKKLIRHVFGGDHVQMLRELLLNSANEQQKNELYAFFDIEADVIP